jgi:hypothetical protein
MSLFWKKFCKAISWLYVGWYVREIDFFVLAPPVVASDDVHQRVGVMS